MGTICRQRWAILVALVFASPSWAAEPRTTKPRVDFYGDPLPQGAIARLGTVRFRHPGVVHAVALTAECKLIAAANDDWSMIIIWDRVTGRKLHEIAADSRPLPPLHLRFSADGERLYAALQQGRDRKMHAWDVETGTDAKDIPPMPAARNVLGYSPDAREVILLDRKGEIVRWDIEAGKERGRYPEPDHVPTLAALVGDRLLVPQYDGEEISLWDAAAKKQLWSAKMSRDKNWPILPIAFSLDGKLFAFEAPPREISVHESVSGKLVRQLKAEVEKIYYSVAISPDARTVVGNNLDGTLRVWDLESGRERVQPPLQGGWCDIFFSPDSRIFAINGKKAVLFWETASGQRALPFRGHSWQVSSASFSPDGKIAATSSWPGGHPVVQLWDVPVGRPLRSFDTPSITGSLEVAFSPDGKTLAAVGNAAKEQVWIWDARTGRQLHALGGHESQCTCVAFSPDGKRLVSGDRYSNRKRQPEGRLCIWDVESGKRIREIRGTRGDIRRVLFTPDGRYILAAAYGIHVYDAETGQLVGQPFPAKTWIDNLALSADGQLLAHSSGPVRLWELATRREIPLSLPSGDSVALTADGRTLAIGSPKRDVLLFHWPSGKTIGRLAANFDVRTRVSFSPDSRKLATVWHPDSTALIWDVASLINHPLPAVARPTRADLRRWWADLSDADPGIAYKAVWRFVAVPEQTLPFLTASVQPVKHVDPATVARLIAELDSDQFKVRERASQELSRLGEAVADALRKAKNNRPSLEQRLRIERLLAELVGPVLNPERLRAIRAVVVLEQIGNAEARKILAALAAGAARARQTQEAKAALERLKRPSRARSAAE